MRIAGGAIFTVSRVLCVMAHVFEAWVAGLLGEVCGEAAYGAIIRDAEKQRRMEKEEAFNRMRERDQIISQALAPIRTGREIKRTNSYRNLSRARAQSLPKPVTRRLESIDHGVTNETID